MPVNLQNRLPYSQTEQQATSRLDSKATNLQFGMLNFFLESYRKRKRLDYLEEKEKD